MIFFPPAKINLGLYVHRKRADGFHEIETCMVSIPFTDILEIIPADAFVFHQTGLVVDADPESNLCVRAFRLMQSTFGIPNVYMHLRKQIPMGAGMGGGSADAAYVLLGLNQLFSLNCPVEKLQELAGQLGSDCPFFILNLPQLATGRGEILSPIEVSLAGYWITFIHPGIHVSTKEAYAGIQFVNNVRPAIESIVSQPIQKWKDLLVNDFERSIFPSHPELEEIKNQLYQEGAVYAAMSGSGSTLFGIYDKKPDFKTLKNPNWVQETLYFS